MISKKSCLLLVFCFSIYNICLFSQIGGLQLLGDKDKVSIPFEYKAGYIILNVNLQNYVHQNFIFDTGAEHTIYFHHELANLLGFNIDKMVSIMGADLNDPIKAYISRNILIGLQNCKLVPNDIVLLDADYLNLFEHTGEQIDGIIGGRFFRNLVVDIDYRKKVLTLSNPNTYNQKLKGYDKFDLEIDNSKPYVKCHVALREGEFFETKMLIDCGAALSLLLQAETDGKIIIPPQAVPGKLGKGIGGYVQGYLGKLNTFRFGSHEFKSLFTSYQVVDSLIQPEVYNYRNGIIGNLLLERFDIVINYLTQKLYIKPNRKFRKPIRYNKSGIVIFSVGSSQEEFFIFEVLAGSPAQKADIRRGDIIKKIGNLKAKFLSLDKIDRLLSKKVGKKYKMVIEREGKEIKKIIILEDFYGQ